MSSKKNNGIKKILKKDKMSKKSEEESESESDNESASNTETESDDESVSELSGLYGSDDSENESESDSESGSEDSGSESELSDASENYEEHDLEKEDKNKFFEDVVEFLKTDNLMKKKREEFNEGFKVLKEKKSELEAGIMRYLDRLGEEYVEVKGEGRLIKTVSETKAAIKEENIREGILEGIKLEKLIEKDEDALSLIGKIMEIIDKKRPINKREYLKRTKEKKKKKGKKNDKGKKSVKGKNSAKVKSAKN